MSETLEHKMEELPASAPQAADAHSKPAGKVSGLERAALGTFSVSWKVPVTYLLLAGSAAYAPYALPAALGVGAAFFCLNYFGLKVPFIRDTYKQIKETALNTPTYAKNFLTATTGFLQNLITSPSKILPAYGAASPGAEKGMPQPAH